MQLSELHHSKVQWHIEIIFTQSTNVIYKLCCTHMRGKWLKFCCRQCFTGFALFFLFKNSLNFFIGVFSGHSYCHYNVLFLQKVVSVLNFFHTVCLQTGLVLARLKWVFNVLWQTGDKDALKNHRLASVLVPPKKIKNKKDKPGSDSENQPCISEK